MSFFRIILKVFGIALLSVFLFVFGNYVINWFERNYGNDIDFQSLKEYSNKHGLSENFAIVVDFEKPSGKHRFYVCDLNKQKIIASSVGKITSPLVCNALTRVIFTALPISKKTSIHII